MSNHKSLIFFNKEEDYLNFNYNDSAQRFEGDILFHENSNDTFKTYGLYMFEKVPSFEFESLGELTTNKFQLFNEFGLHLYGAKYKLEKITSIEPVNNDSDFYTKWIYGENFHAKFPVGTIIRFDSPLLEFLDSNRTYVVVQTKLGAIMIVSQMDNDTFETTYFTSYTSNSTYTGKTITGLNAVGVYNYIDSSYNNTLSNWNEPNFYDKYYLKRKLNIMNSDDQVGDETFGPLFTPLVVTVDNISLTDLVHFEYFVNKSNLPQNSELIIEVLTRTDVPRIYNGPITVESDNKIRIDFLPDYPQILKSGVEFKIIGSPNNTNFFTVAPIPEWNGIVNETFFATHSQVIWNNKIYECQTAYTQSFGSASTQFITPDDLTYWDLPTYIYVEQPTFTETVLQAQIYLTSDRYYFNYPFTQSSETTLASAAQKWKDDLNLFNIDLYYEKNNLKADLIYPSKYAKVNFYFDNVSSTYSIGGVNQTIERICGIKEEINYELNYNISENFEYRVVFTDLDEFGIKILINGQLYEEELSAVYSGSSFDMERTIDRTLRNWLQRNYVRLYTIGIIANLSYIGNLSSVFYNSIILKTQYPNVPLELERVEVGSTADFYIEHSTVLFNSGTYSMPYLSININGTDYGVTSSFLPNTNITDVLSTISKWVDAYSFQLSERGIIVTAINYLLKIDVKSVQNNLVYEIKNGRVQIPGLPDYKITNKIKGNVGMFITSNEVLLPQTSTQSFELAGFSTGMLFAINNTFWPWVNQEYNIQFLDPTVLNLSYQGPFWGLTDSICNSSAFATIAFNLGFGQTACVVPVGPTAVGGPFDPYAFNSGFSLIFNTNTYNTTSYNFSTYPGSSNLVDIKYIQLSNCIYGFGDSLIVVDSFLGDYLTTINLPGNTGSIVMEFNPINNYLYCLSSQNIYVIDPLINSLVSQISFTSSTSFPDPTALARDIKINPINGDVYLTYFNRPRVDIWSENNLTNNRTVYLDSSVVNFPPGVVSTGKMVFNDFEGDMYITTDSPLGYVMRVNSNRTIQTNYNIPGLTHSIFYEPVYESIYVYGSQSLWQIDNGLTQSISINTTGFNDIIFNNLTGEMNISDSSFSFTKLDILNDIPTVYSGYLDYGYLALNQFDGDVYMTSQVFNKVLVINPVNGNIIKTITISSGATKLIYNPDRNSIWSIQPSINSMIEVEVVVNSQINILPFTYSSFGDNQYGTLDSSYVQRPEIWLKSREFIRRPRENYEGDVRVDYYWRWLDDQKPQFFFYDFSGDQLIDNGSFSYIGPKPLTNIVLNRKPNKDLALISEPSAQQTIFDQITNTLSYIDDSDDISIEPEPLELFIGFRSDDEGPLSSTLQLIKREVISVIIDSDAITKVYLSTTTDSDRRGIINIDSASSEIFTGRGLKPGQIIVINLNDISNIEDQYTSLNNASLFIIREVYTKTLVLDFINESDILFTEETVINDYPKSGDTTYLSLNILVKDREIGRFNVYGQTEEEDERFKIELGNIGKLINPDEVFIFKEYDILEGGIDWTILNNKRKEMLMMKHLIYPYIGAYKSIINAINYFGYNDLQLNEYYRNIDSASPDFLKLFKVEIPDIFDNTVEGWTENDYIKNTYPNENFEETNLFNLTYFITDKEGSIILNYSIDEVIIKLQGLKYWLKKNIIPLTHKILDITGRSYFNQVNSITHKTIDINNIRITDEMTPVTFKLSESYLMPVNSGSTVYNCVLDFYSIIPGVGSDITPSPTILEKPKPFNGSILNLPDTFNIKIRTYKTYKEWVPFLTYNSGDKVIYYGKIYESVIDNNRVNNPRKFESVPNWSANSTYQTAAIVNYQREFYVFSGLGQIFNYKINTSSTTGNPGLGQLIYNNLIQVNSTQISISFESLDAQDRNSILATITVGSSINIQTQNNASNFQKWLVIDPVPIQTGTPNYWTFNVQLISSSGLGSSGFSNGDLIHVSFFSFSGNPLNVVQTGMPPTLDSLNWLKVTEWKQINFEPVQTITEFREGTNLLPFNFTIDSNIDPFLVIEVTSDNGYGEIFRDRKNYEIRGLKDLQDPYRYIDPLGPFIPITPVI